MNNEQNTKLLIPTVKKKGVHNFLKTFGGFRRSAHFFLADCRKNAIFAQMAIDENGILISNIIRTTTGKSSFFLKWQRLYY